MIRKKNFVTLASIASVVFLGACYGNWNAMSTVKDSRSLSNDDLSVYKQEYYNLVSENASATSFLPLDHYPVGEGSVIALLVSARPQDVQEAQTALRSLAFLKGDKDQEHLAPVLIFNEGDLSDGVIQALIQSTNRPIGFPLVNFLSFPPGFNPDTEKHDFIVQGRKPWGYYQMIRFWLTMVWKHPSIQRFDAVMRLDSDSCFKEENSYLPNFMYDGLYYHSQYVGTEPQHGAKFIQGMYDFALNWMETTKQPHEPRNALLWHFTESLWKTEETLPIFRTNFELSKIHLMQRGDVARFHEALTEKAPFPMLRNRWGDAVLRFLMVSIFENNDKVMTVRPTGYFHKIGCSADEVNEALSKLDGYVEKPIDDIKSVTVDNEVEINQDLGINDEQINSAISEKEYSYFSASIV